ncbi:MAG: signal peptidase I [Candidatus Coatesbacteria bacterium]|nr:signal peptidase I [Candidatus Coatesbacteria bacterium]
MGPIAQRLIEYVEVAAIAILLAFFLRTFVVQAFMIPTGSMETTLLRGDHILVNRMIYNTEGLGPLKWILPVRDPEQLDIMVFKNPTKLQQDYIKRMVGMPGTTIECSAKRLSIDGKEAVYGFERHASPWVIPRERNQRDTFGPVHVPEGNYFMMGDNRDNSLDSRYWGPLDSDFVKGRAFLIYFSWMPFQVAFEDKTESEKPHSLAELVWFNITHLGERLRLNRMLNIIR